jgi:lipopolysaccharide/colanic/teichoic acid biosynthesis glycosyltransferase
VSVEQQAQARGLTVERARRHRSTPFATRLNRALFSTNRWPWVLLEFGVVLLTYEVGLRASPYGTYGTLVSPYVGLSVIYAFVFGAVSLGLGSYDRDQRFDYFSIVRSGVIASVLASLVNLGYHYFTLYTVVGRLTLVFGAAFGLVGMVAVRSFLTWVVGRYPYRFSVVGSSATVVDRITGWLMDRRRSGMYVHVPWESIFAAGERPTAHGLVDANVAEIVVTEKALNDEEAIDFALVALRANVPVVDERTFYARLFERIPIDDVSKRWILEQGLTRPQGVVVATKRLSDIVMASIGLIVFSPLLLAIALAVWLTGSGPILFVQERQGRFYEPFRMFKFRTMRESDGEGGFTRPGDVRVTRLGRVLRRTHLDEMPQLFNILRGEMSVVGPRPESLDFARRMDGELPLYELRYLVRPGLTGHAQLKQGYAMDTVLDTRTKLSYDLYYLCNYSIRMDLQIVLRTLLFLVRGSR